jgi:L,D-peptidoglycan transpeptidase YkuD (ErfK/YbiS/YcfS/YnhG family)
MRAIVLTIAATAGVAGCAKAPTMRYAHPTATQQTFMQDRYTCIQQAQQGRSGAYVNAYGGSSQSTVVTNRGVFTACMGAKGYSEDAKNGHLTAPPGSEISMVE